MSFRLSLDPADTLAIGDGRPFNQNDPGLAIAASVFPPPPDTLYGAARVACARALGWNGTGEWSERNPDIVATMGDWNGPGTFTISGPFFRVDDTVLLPIPSHVVLSESVDGCELVCLTPADKPVTTDLGPVRLLDIPPHGEVNKYYPLAGRWGKADAVLKLLKGEAIEPDDLGKIEDLESARLPNKPSELRGWSLDDLAAPEYRVGIARDTTTRLAADGQLYAAVRRCLRKHVELFVEVEGMEQPDNFSVAVRLGGEARFAFASAHTSLIPAEKSTTGEKYLVYFASPVVLLTPLCPGDDVAGLPGKLVMASIANVTSHSGRTKNTKGKGKRAISNIVVPAGSVLFMEGGDGTENLPERLGDKEKTHMGYGRYFIGVWT